MSEKKRYEKLLKETLIKEVKLWNYVIDVTWYRETKISFTKIEHIIVLDKTNTYWRIPIMTQWMLEYISNTDRTLNTLFSTKGFIARMIINKHHKIYKEWKKEVAIKEKVAKEEFYTEEIKKLLKVRPADKDLQETYDKANRLLEIRKKILEHTKEIRELSK